MTDNEIKRYDEIRILTHKANKGDVCAQCTLGLRYEKGHGVEQNKQESFYWYNQARMQGDLWASKKCELEQHDKLNPYGWGLYFESKNNYDKAIEWYTKADSKESDYRIGKIYIEKYEKLQEGVKWLCKSSNKGYEVAHFELGLYFEHVTKNKKAAMKLYHKAAEQNYYKAQYYLGLLYKETEPDKALNWFHQAAKQQYDMAQLEIARLYRQKGECEKAMVWYGRIIGQEGEALYEAKKELAELIREKRKKWIEKSGLTPWEA